ncbi:MAG: hypothetical protein JW941_03680 [Candidatus Coatesbacteria bacterium]|nr:hypothetical protein [Candidatus Coatesbacteria bacterium]
MDNSALDIISTKKFQRLPSEMAVSADGALIAASFHNGTVMLIDSEGHMLWEKSVGSPATDIGISPDLKFVYTASKNRVVIFDITGAEQRQIKEDAERAVLSPHGEFAFLGSADPTKRISSISFFDATKKSLLKRQPGAIVWKEKFDEAYQFFTGGRDGSGVVLGFARQILCIDKDQRRALDHKVKSTVKSLVVSSDASKILFSTFDGHIIGLDATGKEYYQAELEEEANDLCCDAAGSWVMAALKNTPAILLFNERGRLVWRFSLPGKPIHVRLTDDASIFVVCCAGGEMLVCRNYYVDPKKRLGRGIGLINNPEYTELALNMLARSSTEGLTALVKAIKDGTVPEGSYKLIGKIPEASLPLLVNAMLTDPEPGHLFHCLAAFYMRAAPIILQELEKLAAPKRKEFYSRLSAIASKIPDPRLLDLLGFLHLQMGELDAAMKHFFECLNMNGHPELAVRHLEETLAMLDETKAREGIDQLFRTFA